MTSRKRTRALWFAAAALLGASVAIPVNAQSGEATEAGNYRLIREPIAVYGRQAGQPFYKVYIRLSRAVPRNPSNSPAATVRLGGLGLAEAPGPDGSSMGFLTTNSRRGTFCYEQQLPFVPGAPAEMARPRAGKRLKVEVLIRGVDEPLVRHVRLRRRSLESKEFRRYLRELRCLAPARG